MDSPLPKKSLFSSEQQELVIKKKLNFSYVSKQNEKPGQQFECAKWILKQVEENANEQTSKASNGKNLVA